MQYQCGLLQVRDLEKVEQAQVQSLTRMTGAKAHSSYATEVITNTVPMKIHIRELCSREYLCIISKDQSHSLRQLMSTSLRKGLQFCPLNNLSFMSRQPST